MKLVNTITRTITRARQRAKEQDKIVYMVWDDNYHRPIILDWDNPFMLYEVPEYDIMGTFEPLSYTLREDTPAKLAALFSK